MGNIIRRNDTAPADERLSMSNQGTDCFLEMLLFAADGTDMTENQEGLISFLAERRKINEVSPGNASFDIDEMPWDHDTLRDDRQFLLGLIDKIKKTDFSDRLGYVPDRGIVITWFESFARMISHTE